MPKRPCLQQKRPLTVKGDVPIMVSGTITDASGRTFSGQTAEAFWVSMSHAPLFSIGLNCALGAEQLTPYLEALSPMRNCGISAHPNAGLPNEMGEYDQGPDAMASTAQALSGQGLGQHPGRMLRHHTRRTSGHCLH